MWLDINCNLNNTHYKLIVVKALALISHLNIYVLFCSLYGIYLARLAFVSGRGITSSLLQISLSLALLVELLRGSEIHQSSMSISKLSL